jgi:hypothetical protein
MTKIYLVENCFGDPNKVYIGKTKNSRENDHKKTYGSNIIYTIIDEIDSLDRKYWEPLESYWIDQFRQWGFEVVNKKKKGGGGADFYSQDSKDKISRALKGRVRSLSFGEKMKISMLGKNLGKSRNEKTKLKMRESKLGKPSPLKGIKKGSLNEEQKEKLRVPKKNKENYFYPKTKAFFESVIGKPKKHPKSRNKKISQSLTGYKQSPEHVEKRTNKLKGKSNIKNRKPKPEGFGKTISEKLKGKKHDSKAKPILQYNINGDFIKEFSSITDACNIVFNNRSKNPNITKCCQGKLKTAYGFIWKYKN